MTRIEWRPRRANEGLGCRDYAEAMLVRRVSADFAAGTSPRRITTEPTEIEQLATAS
jgi:hypothetical protein